MCAFITPYKLFDEYDRDKNFKRVEYKVPIDSKFKILREKFYKNDIDKLTLKKEVELDYYVSIPNKKSNYPIVVLCTGGQDIIDLKLSWSVIDLHRHYLREIMDLGCGLLTVERLGVIDVSYEETMVLDHYTISQRIFDHEAVINNLYKDPPKGWNGKLIFWGISEGGLVVQKLSEKYQDNVLLVIVWAMHIFIDNLLDFSFEYRNQLYEHYLKTTSLMNTIKFYAFYYFEKIYDMLVLLIPSKELSIISNKIYYNMFFDKNNYYHLASLLLKNKINMPYTLFDGMPLHYWKDCFSMDVFQYKNFSKKIPLLNIIGEEDVIIKKYCHENYQKIKECLPLYKLEIISNIGHRIRKNDKSLLLTIQSIKEII